MAKLTKKDIQSELLSLSAEVRAESQSLFTAIQAYFADLTEQVEVDIYEFIQTLPDGFDRVLQLEGDGAIFMLLKHWAEHSENPFNNEETFAEETPVWAVAKNKVIVLDAYLFDIDELVAYYRSGSDFKRNPHTSAEFSAVAREQLRGHPLIEPLLSDELLAHQRADQLMTAEVIDAVINMLRHIDRVTMPGFTADASDDTELSLDDILQSALDQVSGGGGGGSKPSTAKSNLERAREYIDAFIEFKSKLSAELQGLLNNYTIWRHKPGGGFDRMNFLIALNGGGQAMGCIITTQVALWQFVKHFRPRVDVPPRVMMAAMAQEYVFSDSDQGSSKPSPADMFMRALGLTLDKIAAVQAQVQENTRHFEGWMRSGGIQQMQAGVAEFQRAVNSGANPLAVLAERLQQGRQPTTAAVRQLPPSMSQQSGFARALRNRMRSSARAPARQVRRQQRTTATQTRWVLRVEEMAPVAVASIGAQTDPAERWFSMRSLMNAVTAMPSFWPQLLLTVLSIWCSLEQDTRDSVIGEIAEVAVNLLVGALWVSMLLGPVVEEAADFKKLYSSMFADNADGQGGEQQARLR